MTATDFTTMKPTEIDTILSKAFASKDLIEGRLDRANAVYEILGELLDDEFAKKRGKDYDTIINGLQNRREELEELLDSIEAELAEAWLTIDGCELEYDRRFGWSRFWQVASATGHVHTSQDCSTRSKKTVFILLPEFSDSADVRVLNEAGSAACSVCFLDAPADLLARKTKLENPKKRRARLMKEVEEAGQISK